MALRGTLNVETHMALFHGMAVIYKFSISR